MKPAGGPGCVLHVVDVRVLQDFRIWLHFNDGIEGVANLAQSLDGAVFEPLRDPAVFAHARLDPELHTVAWANGADMAPEYLHALVTAASPSGRFRP